MGRRASGGDPLVREAARLRTEIRDLVGDDPQIRRELATLMMAGEADDSLWQQLRQAGDGRTIFLLRQYRAHASASLSSLFAEARRGRPRPARRSDLQLRLTALSQGAGPDRTITTLLALENFALSLVPRSSDGIERAFDRLLAGLVPSIDDPALLAATIHALHSTLIQILAAIRAIDREERGRS